MQLAENGLPQRGQVGYEIFDQQSALGTTSFVQNINNVRALEGELARTISSLARIKTRPRPPRPARARAVPPRAPGPDRLDRPLGPRRAFGRRNPRHPAPRRLRHRGPDPQPRLDHRRRRPAPRLGQRQRRELGRSPARPRSARSASRTACAPASRICSPTSSAPARPASRSAPSSTSSARPRPPRPSIPTARSSARPRPASSPIRRRDGAADRGRDGRQRAARRLRRRGDGAATTREQGSTTEETTNYEISKTTETTISEAGGIKRLSVAVVVDGTYVDDGTGDSTYTPRTRRGARADPRARPVGRRLRRRPAATRSRSSTCSSPSGPSSPTEGTAESGPLRLHPRRPDAAAPR